MKNIHVFGCMLAACVAAAAPASAADDSAWSQDSRAAIRLVAGSNAGTTTPLRAGVEIKLQPGWKTYWRYPGDSGVPPRFDFSGSDNLKSATVLYPAPHLFSDEGGNSLGYKDTVIFPIVVTPSQANKPVTLRLKLDYAVCEKLCVPAEGQAELTLQRAASSHDSALVAAEARVPKPTKADAIGLSVRRLNNAAKPLIAVDLKASEPVAIFVEGPTPEWALPIPTPVPGAPAGRRQFNFELDGLPPGTDPKGHFELTFTVVEGEQAMEVKSHLD